MNLSADSDNEHRLDVARIKVLWEVGDKDNSPRTGNRDGGATEIGSSLRELSAIKEACILPRLF